MTPKLAMLVFLGAWLGVSACGGGANEKQGSTCEQNCALNKCPNDATAAVCASTCEMYVARCPAETNASIQCRIALAAGKLICDPANQVTVYADQASCETQNAALAACLTAP